jgi:HEAT repeat protein
LPVPKEIPGPSNRARFFRFTSLPQTAGRRTGFADRVKGRMMLRRGLSPTPCLQGALLALVGWAGAKAEEPPPNAARVGEVQRILHTPVRDDAGLARRRAALSAEVVAFVRATDLRDAWLLPDWRDDDPNEAVAAVDRAARSEFGRRFEQSLLDLLRHGAGESRLAAANLVAEVAPTFPRSVPPDWSGGRLAHALAELTRGPDGCLSAAAARALCLLHPSPALAFPSLEPLLQSGDPVRYRTAADCLLTLVLNGMRTVPGPGGTALEPSVPELLETSRHIIPLLSRCLAHPDPIVRRRCLEAGDRLLLAVVRRLDEPGRAGDRRSGLPPAAIVRLSDALRDLTAALTAGLNDPDAEVRLLVSRNLEVIGVAARALAAEPGIAGTGREALPPRAAPAAWDTALVTVSLVPREPEATVRDGLHVAVTGLASGLGDPDVRVRRASVEVLEMLGEDARAESPALVRALGDADRFVRWAAARAVGRLAPGEADATVPGLARLLEDADVDVRLAAVASLGRYAAAHPPAGSDLVRVIGNGDPDTQVAALRALQNSGCCTQSLIGSLTAALDIPHARVRQAAARLLASLGPAALPAAGALRAALCDPDAGVRKAAGDALLAMRPAPGACGPSADSPPPPVWRSAQLGSPVGRALIPTAPAAHPEVIAATIPGQATAPAVTLRSPQSQPAASLVACAP